MACNLDTKRKKKSRLFEKRVLKIRVPRRVEMKEHRNLCDCNNLYVGKHCDSSYT